MSAPLTSYREIVIDNFAGGGGASNGIHRALGQVDVALNHDDEALAMHLANHPETHHLDRKITSVDPLEVAQGRPIGLAWFSPDCTHHSRAKGGKPRSKGIRDLAWVVPHWAERVRPRVIILENVQEFLDWGPLTEDNRPDPDQKGLEFQLWAKRLRKAGYRIEWRVLSACDYGAPTTRKRLFVIARCDERPIVWPEPTHGPGLLPYRTAAECIDWSIPCPSIFPELGRKRPLAPATLRRIARGIVKYVLNNPRPFIVPLTHTTGGNQAHSVDAPLRTITTAKGGELALATPFFVPRYGERTGQDPRCQPADRPLSTIVTTANGAQLVAAFLAQHNGGMVGHPADRPMSTVTETGSQQQVVTAHLMTNTTGHAGAPADGQVPTVTTGGHHALVAAFLQAYYRTDQDPRITNPLPTVTTADRFSVVTVTIEGTEYALVDIGMRMLTPRELFRAQGFEDSYVIDPIGPNGKPLTKTAQIRMCGNSVCPPVAEALARANVELQDVALPGAVAMGGLFA